MRCSVADEECVSGRLRRGMCERHYRRYLNHGDTAATRLAPLTMYEVLPGGCWRWTGATWRNGYGRTSVPVHGTRLAHRAFYLEHVGPIPEGRDLDHRCHNAESSCVRGEQCPHRLCVNPDHLEPVGRHTNLTRAIASRLVCENGLHDLTAPGAIRKGTVAGCVQCWRERYRAAGRRYRERQKAAAT